MAACRIYLDIKLVKDRVNATLLPQVEFASNNFVKRSIRKTPFQILDDQIVSHLCSTDTPIMEPRRIRNVYDTRVGHTCSCVF